MLQNNTPQEDMRFVRPGMRTSMLGVLVRNARLQHGLTISQLAEKSGVDKSIISRLETGMTRSAQDDNIDALARVLDISPDVLKDLSQRSARPPSPEVARALARIMPPAKVQDQDQEAIEIATIRKALPELIEIAKTAPDKWVRHRAGVLIGTLSMRLNDLVTSLTSLAIPTLEFVIEREGIYDGDDTPPIKKLKHMKAFYEEEHRMVAGSR